MYVGFLLLPFFLFFPGTMDDGSTCRDCQTVFEFPTITDNQHARRIGRGRKKSLLSVEKTPPPFDTTEFIILPLLVEVFKEEVASAVGIGLTYEGVHKSLEVGHGSIVGAIVCIRSIRGFL